MALHPLPSAKEPDQPRRGQRGAPFPLPRSPSLATALGQCSSPLRWRPGMGGWAGSLFLALMPAVQLVHPSSRPAAGSHLAPCLF